MHSSSFDTEIKTEGDVLVAIAALVTEGRIPAKLNTKSKGFYEGPHCSNSSKTSNIHKCDLADSLCLKFENVQNQVLNLWKKNIPLCIEVILICPCKEELNETSSDCREEDVFLLEKWYFSINNKRTIETAPFNFDQLVNAIRSQLYFSQLSAWLTVQNENPSFKITNRNLFYNLTIPGETFESSKFTLSAIKHDFPATDIGNGFVVNVSLLSLPRMSSMPNISCNKCCKKSGKPLKSIDKFKENLLDDRMHTFCTMKGKHRCEDFEDFENGNKHYLVNYKRFCQNNCSEPSTSSKSKLSVNIETAKLYSNIKLNHQSKNDGEEKAKSDTLCKQNLVNSHKNDLTAVQDKGQLLLDAIERSGQKSTNGKWTKSDEHIRKERKNESDRKDFCDMRESDIFSLKGKSKYNDNCDSRILKLGQKKIDYLQLKSSTRTYKSPRRRFTFDDDDDDFQIDKSDDVCNKKLEKDNLVEIPSALEQAKFRKDLDNAASMVFHSRTGLPLTSSPAPVRRGKSCFDFDSSLNSVSAIKSALFSASFSTDEESESDCSIISPCSPEISSAQKKEQSPIKYRRKGHAANLLGSFEESVLNGRLEPNSTVHGFTAELGASGSFVPKHLVVPVTVFFYTLGDSDKVSSPYLGHINLGRKGYNVPKSGTVQVTLFNPLGTVVKMFVIMYDLSDMPANSQTFIRQRTLYMPTNCKDENVEWGPKWLRYLIHLRFISSKSGKIYLHSDIRMIIFRKCDLDTATAHGIDMSYELRSFTHMPTNPRFSPRK